MPGLPKQKKGNVIPDQPSNNELEQMFAYFAANGAIDLQHQNARPAEKAIIRQILHEASQGYDMEEWASAVKTDNPEKIRKAALKNIFQANGSKAFEGLNYDNIVVAPETSTAFLRAARRIAAKNATNPVVLIPEGNYRRNESYDKVTGVKMVVVPVDATTGKMTAKALEEKIRECKDHIPKQTPVLLQMEAPNNPLMQIYSAREQKEICRVVEANGMFLLHDAYLLGTEYPQKQDYFAQHSRDPDKVITLYGMRRIGHVDSFAKAGFAIATSPEVLEALRQDIASHNIRFSEGNLTAAERIVDEVMTPEKAKEFAKALHEARAHAEGAIKAKSNLGLKVPIEAQAGPFIVLGFDENTLAEMRKVGITNGFRAAEYFAANGVNLMPVEIMSSGIHKDAFRVNCTCDFDKGLERIEKVLGKIRAGVSYDSVRNEVARAYAEGEEITQGRHK